MGNSTINEFASSGKIDMNFSLWNEAIKKLNQFYSNAASFDINSKINKLKAVSQLCPKDTRVSGLYNSVNEFSNNLYNIYCEKNLMDKYYQQYNAMDKIISETEKSDYDMISDNPQFNSESRKELADRLGSLSNDEQLDADLLKSMAISILPDFVTDSANHLYNLGSVALDGIKNLNGDYSKLISSASNAVITGDYDAFNDALMSFGNTAVGSVLNVANELWAVDAGCTVYTGARSLLLGAEKFSIGIMSDYGSTARYFSNFGQIDVEEHNRLKNDINSVPNYKLSDSDHQEILNYYIDSFTFSDGDSNVNRISDAEIDALIDYYSNLKKQYSNVQEYDEILGILYDIKNNDLTTEQEVGRLMNVYRIDKQSSVDARNEDFYNSSAGSFVNDNSYLKWDSQLAHDIEENSEQALIVSSTFAEGFCAGVVHGIIPFSDRISLFKNPHIENGEEYTYLPYELGADNYNLIFMGGDITGQLTVEIAIDILLGGAVANPSSAATAVDAADAVVDTARVIDKADDAVDAVRAIDKADDVVDVTRAIDKADDVVDSTKAMTNYNAVSKALENAQKSPEGMSELYGLFEKYGLKRPANINEAYNRTFELINAAEEADKAMDAARAGSRLSQSIDVVNNLDDVGDVTRAVNNVTDTATGTKKYEFKIDYSSVPKENVNIYKNQIENMSNTMNFDENVGRELEKVFDTSDDYVLGIHKSGIADPNAIMDEGLWLTGHNGVDSSADDFINLNLNVVFENPVGDAKDLQFLKFCKNIEGSAGYKTVEGTGNSIIVKIPRQYMIFDGEGYIIKPEFVNELVDFSGNIPTLKSKYIFGYVPTFKDGLGKVNFGNIVYNNLFNV